MTPERWHQVEQLYQEALQREPSERAAFLTGVCAEDVDLRREIESLLRYAPAADRFIEAPALEVVTAMLGDEHASLVGHAIGTYKVLDLLGSGGMGVVYRAYDTRLERTVAIKLLDAVATGHDSRSRVLAEARLASKLNHPHICTVYEVVEDADAPFIVLEYVEGQTLTQRIAGAALPAEQVLRYGRQIAEALAHAHEHGILHRDLKSANIVVTPDGRAKVLDFGLACHLLPETLDSMSHSRAALSEIGSMAGTLPYMAPEMLRGEPADARCDIWAFGVLLHEMASGALPFKGHNAFDLTAAIMREPAPPLAPGASGGLRAIVARCLAKEPGQRYRRVSEVSAALETIQFDERAISEHSQHTLRHRGQLLRWLQAKDSKRDAPAVTGWRLWRDGVWAVSALVTVVLAIALVTVRFRPATTLVDTPEMRFEVVTPPTPDQRSLALSPDGRRLVFVAASDGPPRLWLRSLDAVGARPISGTENAAFPFWSPDSRSIGFFADGKLKRLDVDGGSPQTLTTVRNGRGGAWNPDGVILFALAGSRLLQMPASGGEVMSAMPQVAREYDHRFPQFLPDGRHFIFLGTAQRRDEQGVIYLSSLDAPTHATQLTASDTAAAYLSPSWLLYVRQGVLVARRFDVGRSALTGEQITLADAVGVDDEFGSGGFSASRSGVIAYRANAVPRTQLTWVDRNGRPVGVLREPEASSLSGPELSPEGRRVAIDRVTERKRDVWLIETGQGMATRLTFEPPWNGWPLWSPDGRSIVFTKRKVGLDLYLKPSSGAGREEMLVESAHQKVSLDWSPDGRFLLYFENDPQTGRDLWVVPMAGQRTPKPFLKTRFDERGGQFSPDGRWIAYQSNETGRFEIYVRPFPGPGGQWQVSTHGGITPRWRRDGQELFYLAPDATLMAARDRLMGTVFEADAPAALFKTRIVGGAEVLKPQYAVAGDGRFLINMAVEEANASPITVIANWKPGLTNDSR